MEVLKEVSYLMVLLSSKFHNIGMHGIRTDVREGCGVYSCSSDPAICRRPSINNRQDLQIGSPQEVEPPPYNGLQLTELIMQVYISR